MLAVPDGRVNFVYELSGDISEVDVFNLAPTLLSIGKLIQEANAEINPNGRQIGVNVKPFRKGSFRVDLILFPHTNFQQILDLISSHPFDQIKTLLEWLGMIGGGGAGVVKLVKWLNGRPKSVEEISPGEFRYTSADDRSITVNTEVHQLFSKNSITQNIYNVYGAPLEQTRTISEVKTYLEGNEKSEVRIERDDVPALKQYAEDGEKPTPIVKKTIHEDVFLNPKRGSFDGDPKDWSFRRGTEIVTATIKDKDFINRCTQGEYRLNHSDLLTVTMAEYQKVIGTEVCKPTYEIVHVKNYTRGE